jgi:hypothetical protein
LQQWINEATKRTIEHGKTHWSRRLFDLEHVIFHTLVRDFDRPWGLGWL